MTASGLAIQTVAVCVPTHRRPEALARLLGALAGQRFTLSPPPRMIVVVVDNTPDGEVRFVCDDARFAALEILYGVEPRIGIPFARNRCLDLAVPVSDWLAFIDDDEVPEPDWLEELIATQRRCGGDVIVGPVLPHYEIPPPAWIERGGFHANLPETIEAHPRRIRTLLRRLFAIPVAVADGAELGGAATGNVMFSVALVNDSGLRFDETLHAYGYGEDSQFFWQARARGYRFRWASAAVARHIIPPHRATWRWLVRRAFQNGVCHTVITDRIDARRGVPLLLVAKHIAAIAILIPCLPVAALVGRHIFFREVQQIAVACGQLSAALGLRPTYLRALPPAASAGGPPIFVIHLKDSPRFEVLRAQLSGLGLPFEIFDAIDGYALSDAVLAERYDRERAIRTHGRPLGRGEVGCALSHSAIYDMIVARGYPMAIVLEEDARIGPDFLSFWRQASSMPGHVGLLSLFASYGHVRRRPDATLGTLEIHRAADQIGGTVGYMVRHDVAQRLRLAGRRVESVADWPFSPRSLLHHVALPQPVSHDPAVSALDIERRESYDRPYARIAWLPRKLRSALYVSGIGYLVERRRYADFRNYYWREMRDRLWWALAPLLRPIVTRRYITLPYLGLRETNG